MEKICPAYPAGTPEASGNTMTPTQQGQFGGLGAGAENLMGWAPHPNPPPLVFPPLCISPYIGGQEPTSIDTQTGALLTNLLVPGDAFGAPTVLYPGITYYLVIDSYNLDNGPFDIDLVLTPFPCSAVDYAFPAGVLDFSDVFAFLVAFGGLSPLADLAPPFGVFDFSDVFAFLVAFGDGCP